MKDVYITHLDDFDMATEFSYIYNLHIIYRFLCQTMCEDLKPMKQHLSIHSPAFHHTQADVR